MAEKILKNAAVPSWQVVMSPIEWCSVGLEPTDSVLTGGDALGFVGSPSHRTAHWLGLRRGRDGSGLVGSRAEREIHGLLRSRPRRQGAYEPAARVPQEPGRGAASRVPDRDAQVPGHLPLRRVPPAAPRLRR